MSTIRLFARRKNLRRRAVSSTETVALGAIETTSSEFQTRSFSSKSNFATMSEKGVFYRFHMFIHLDTAEHNILIVSEVIFT